MIYKRFRDVKLVPLLKTLERKRLKQYAGSELLNEYTYMQRAPRSPDTSGEAALSGMQGIFIVTRCQANKCIPLLSEKTLIEYNY